MAEYEDIVSQLGSRDHAFEEYKARQKEREKGSASDILAGATPLLLGILTGETAAGLQAAGQAVGQVAASRREAAKEYDEGLLKYAMRDSASTEWTPLSQPIMKEGKPYIAAFNKKTQEVQAIAPQFLKPSQAKEQRYRVERNGKVMLVKESELRPTEIAGFSKQIRTIPGTGELGVINAATGEIQQMGAPAGNISVGPAEYKRSVEIKKDVDKQIAPYKTAFALANTLRTLAENPTQQNLAMVQSQIPRLAGEKGVMTDRDVTRNLPGQSLKQKFSDWYSKLKTGKISELSQEQVKFTLDVLAYSAAKTQQDRAQKALSAYQKAGFKGELSPMIAEMVDQAPGSIQDIINKYPKLAREEGLRVSSAKPENKEIQRMIKYVKENKNKPLAKQVEEKLKRMGYEVN